MKILSAGSKETNKIDSGYTLAKSIIFLLFSSLLLIGFCSYLMVKNEFSKKKLESINQKILVTNESNLMSWG